MSSSSSTHPLRSFLFPMPDSFGLRVVPLPLSVRVFRLELITTSSTRRANQEEKNMIKKTILSVAAKRRGRYSSETVGETKTKPSGNDSVATAGLLPWLTKRRWRPHTVLCGRACCPSPREIRQTEETGPRGDISPARTNARRKHSA